MRRILPIVALALTGCAPVFYPAFGQSQETAAPWHWSGEIQKDHWVYVRNLNGAVRVEAGTGDKVEVTAVKRWRLGNPEDVKISVVQTGAGKGDLLVCALFRDGDSCDERGYHSSRTNWVNWGNHDVSVELTIRLPAGARMNASTVNGSLNIEGATSEVIAHTVNGGITARSSGGAVSAKTTNGSINVRSALFDHEHSEISTVNGSVTVELTEALNATLDMRTVNGSVSSDFPITISGDISRRHVRGTLGTGGPTVKLSTVNGSVRLRKA